MTDSLRRAIRTALQSFLFVFAALAIPWANEIVTSIVSAKPYELNFDVLQSAGIAGVFAAGISLVTYIQNALEDKTHMPAILKSPTSEGKNPVPDDAGPAV